jgi:hypothetical protein
MALRETGSSFSIKSFELPLLKHLFECMKEVRLVLRAQRDGPTISYRTSNVI